MTLATNAEVVAGLTLWTLCVAAIGVLPVIVRRSWVLQAPPIDVVLPLAWLGLVIGGAILLALGFGLAG